ncbi:MAG: Uma2 family endonuclease, partial [Chloroflexi bacterium]
LFPRQGTWSEEEYLALPTNRLVEFSEGHIEVLPMPTQVHQLIVAYLYRRLWAFLERHLPGAMALFAPLPIQLWPGKYRAPDIAVMLAEHAHRRHERYWEAPDLVVEVVSPENRRHDLETKRREYAQAGIPEYWIVDPEAKQITVLTLKGEQYVVHGGFGPGSVARSVVLPGFEVAVDDVWAAAQV